MNPNLSPRELEVAKLMATGHTYKSVAATLGLAIKTVENYVFTFRQKTNIHSIAGTVHYMIVKGYVEAGECV